ncbi:Protein of unknown function [Andreprevotia lacus DSM 23236]|uniref:DUF3617 family protein n=1 Tax=Andreprevotia lacus DSM 23236 TaxID=1121001 RepID=A0A1W1X9C3_9NEIS|nr:DUF3617 family protein [Andreprevotia lacus]SMC20605.1 Protein of unknown function [Andreprevotia lacus DSM 23236]
MRLIALLACVATVPVWAAPAAPAQPPLLPAAGQWQIVTQLPPDQLARMQQRAAEGGGDRGGPGGKMTFDAKAGTMTRTQCLNAESLSHWGQGMQRRRDDEEQPKCDAPKYTVSNKTTLTIDLKCSAPEPSSSHAVYRFDAKRGSYTFEQSRTRDGETRNSKGTAKRIGDC